MADDILAIAKQAVENQAAGWGKDGDANPAVLFRDRSGDITYVSLIADMNSGEAKNHLAQVIEAQLIIGGATEVVYLSSTWMLLSTRMEDRKLNTIEDHPDRVEAVALMHFTLKEEGLHRAIIDRSGKLPTLRPWETFPGLEMGGRFGNALKEGLRMAKTIPQEMIDLLAKLEADGEHERTLRMVMRAKAEAAKTWADHQDRHPQLVFGCQLCQTRRSMESN